jgi:hypothetical protein
MANGAGNSAKVVRFAVIMPDARRRSAELHLD